jgi:hypothetical protein
MALVPRQLDDFRILTVEIDETFCVAIQDLGQAQPDFQLDLESWV